MNYDLCILIWQYVVTKRFTKASIAKAILFDVRARLRKKINNNKDVFASKARSGIDICLDS